MFQFTVSAGDIGVILALIGVLFRYERKLAKYMIEHEILVNDYCERKNMELTDLPTRSKRPF